MTIYAKTLSDEWRTAFEQYESVSGFEPMYQEDIASGEMTPAEAWKSNIRWLQEVVASCENIQIPFEEEN